MTSTEKRLQEIKEREAKATNGPWTHHNGPMNHVVTTSKETNRQWVIGDAIYHKDDSDASFIAHARSDIPFLLGLVEKYQKALEDIGCNETYHRLGGIDDCPRCAALKDEDK